MRNIPTTKLAVPGKRYRLPSDKLGYVARAKAERRAKWEEDQNKRYVAAEMARYYASRKEA